MLLLKGKTSKEVDKASKETGGASEEAGRGGGGRKMEERGKGEEEVVKCTTSSSVAMTNREACFRNMRENGEILSNQYTILSIGVSLVSRGLADFW
jgi:hypothetical protein